jgi:hypothetical protein
MVVIIKNHNKDIKGFGVAVAISYNNLLEKGSAKNNQSFLKTLYMDYLKPSLIEPGVRYFLNGTLKECRKFKDNYISVLFNISMIILLVVVIGGWLLYRYKGKPTQAELELKNRKKQEYIVSKLQQLAFEKKRNTPNTTMITGLPTF